MTRKNPHAVALGRRGGKVSSPAKARAAKKNAKKPRPREKWSPHAASRFRWTWRRDASRARIFFISSRHGTQRFVCDPRVGVCL